MLSYKSILCLHNEQLMRLTQELQNEKLENLLIEELYYANSGFHRQLSQ